MTADARHEGEIGADGLSGREEEGAAFLAGEEEGFGIGAEDDEAGEAGAGEVGEVFGLGGEVEGVGFAVEEGYCGAPDAGAGDAAGGLGRGCHCLFV